MTVKTYNEILEDLCNAYDELITPKSLRRANSNIMYLMFKAIAKSLEVINNVVVALDSKFDPAVCDDSDLVSVAKLVGTEKLSGSGSGLAITITNPTESDITMERGEYTYSLDAETDFTFTLTDTITIPSASAVRYIAMTRTIGSFPVTRQESITVKGKQGDVELEINPNLVFSNADNSSLLGQEAETNLAFRKRILKATTRQNVIEELEEKLLSLPYIINCKIIFNQTVDSVVYSGFTIPPFTMLINVDGDVTEEVATIIAGYGIYPTLKTDDSKVVYFKSDIFASGNYPIYYRYFDSFDYTVDIVYEIDRTFTSPKVVETAITSAVLASMNDNSFRQTIREGDIYTIIEGLNLKAFTLLSVELRQNGTRQPYLEVPKTKIARITDITYTERV